MKDLLHDLIGHEVLVFSSQVIVSIRHDVAHIRVRRQWEDVLKTLSDKR